MPIPVSLPSSSSHATYGRTPPPDSASHWLAGNSVFRASADDGSSQTGITKRVAVRGGRWLGDDWIIDDIPTRGSHESLISVMSPGWRTVERPHGARACLTLNEKYCNIVHVLRVPEMVFPIQFSWPATPILLAPNNYVKRVDGLKTISSTKPSPLQSMYTKVDT